MLLQNSIIDMEGIMNELFEKLYANIDKEGIQKTNKKITKKGYDTTGYGYQWIVDRFNDNLGDSWNFEWEIIKELTGQFRNNVSYHEITVKLGIWINNKDNIRYCVGGHTASNYYDAVKGAIRIQVARPRTAFVLRARPITWTRRPCFAASSDDAVHSLWVR